MKQVITLLLVAPLAFADRTPIAVSPQADDIDRSAAARLADYPAKRAPAALTSSPDEMCASGIRLDRPLQLDPGAAMGGRFAAGRYTAKATAFPRQTVEAGIRQAAEGQGGKLTVTPRPPPGGATVCALELSMDGSPQ